MFIAWLLSQIWWSLQPYWPHVFFWPPIGFIILDILYLQKQLTGPSFPLCINQSVTHALSWILNGLRKQNTHHSVALWLVTMATHDMRQLWQLVWSFSKIKRKPATIYDAVNDARERGVGKHWTDRDHTHPFFPQQHDIPVNTCRLYKQSRRGKQQWNAHKFPACCLSTNSNKLNHNRLKMGGSFCFFFMEVTGKVLMYLNGEPHVTWLFLTRIYDPWQLPGYFLPN